MRGGKAGGDTHRDVKKTEVERQCGETRTDTSKTQLGTGCKLRIYVK